jgi:hypothetical protein
MGGTFLNKIVGLDHLADIVGWVRAEILASVSQFTDRHIILADVIEDDGLRGVEIAHPFGIKFPRHLKNWRCNRSIMRIALKYSSISNTVSYGVVAARNLLCLRAS